jgi:hypothetical protein
MMRYSIVKTIALLAAGFALLGGASHACLANDGNLADDIVLSSDDEIALSGNDMEFNRGAFDINTLTSDQSLAAETTGNTLNVQGNLTNGNIYMGDHFGGLGSYVMNTGNNSSISSAVSVNIQMMTGP